jgi:hypothetical protein
MRFFRYRKPSLKTALGITRAKKRLKKELGITAAMKPFRAPKNLERRIKRKLGYYSTPAKIVRNGPPTPLGCLVPVVVGVVVAVVVWVV